jgi:NAD(P)-dependent dehydrogenase (short-subunit alcohol dehydrogenase family)
VAALRRHVCAGGRSTSTFTVHPPASASSPPKTRPPVALVLGAGAGIGAHVGARFAREGFHAALTRRSDAGGLERAVREIQGEGGDATGFICNVVNDGAIEDLVAHIETHLGPIEVAVFNLGAQIGHQSLQDTTLKQFTLGWQMAQFGLFRAAKSIFPHMVKRGSGTLLVTSATAAMRGNAGQHSHASAMGGRRMLCQTLNAEFSSQNIHVAHIIIDGAVDAPDTLGKMIGRDNFETLRNTRGAADGLVMPSAVAETYWQVASQHRSTWTHELDLRSWSDDPWWNQTSGGL